MAERELETGQHTAESTPEQGPKNPPTLQAKVSGEVRREVNEALTDFGFESAAEGLRMVMKAFARSADVREAVRRNLSVALLDVPAKEPAV